MLINFTTKHISPKGYIEVYSLMFFLIVYIFVYAIVLDLINRSLMKTKLVQVIEERVVRKND